MLLPLLGACAVVGPFQGPEWEPVRGLLSEGRSCRDPRCCGNLVILCLFVIWQIRHTWHQVTRTHPSMKKTSKVPRMKWAVPSSAMRCDTCLRLAPELHFSPGEFKALDAHIQQWAQRKRWEYQRSLQESWAQCLLSWQHSCQRPPWDVCTTSEPIFGTTTFSSTCMLPQDSSWEAWQVPWCLHDDQMFKSLPPALNINQRMEQLLVHSQEELTLEPVVNMRSYSTSTTSATSLPNPPSTQSLQLCSREFLPVPSNQQVGIPTLTFWSCPQEAWASERESQRLGREDSRENQAPGQVSQRDSRGGDAWEIQASGSHFPIDSGMEEDVETKVVEKESQISAISKSDGKILTPGWEKQDHMGGESRAKIQELGERNQEEAGDETTSEIQKRTGENQEQLRCKIDAETQTPDWGNQDKSRNEEVLEIQTFEKNKKEVRGEDEAETQAQGLGKQDQTGSENDEETQVPGWGKQDQIRGTNIQAELMRNKDQVGGENAVQTQVPGSENLGEEKNEDYVQTLEWENQECVGSETVIEIWIPRWEKLDQDRSEKSGKIQVPKGEIQKQLRRELQMGWGIQGLRRGEVARATQLSRRKTHREIREEDWVVLRPPWCGHLRPAVSDVDIELRISCWRHQDQIGSEHRVEIQALERDWGKDGDEDHTNPLAPKTQNQGLLRGESHVEIHPPRRKKQEQFGDENCIKTQMPGERNARGVEGEDGQETQEFGEESQGRRSSEINRKGHIQELIRGKDGANTQASEADNWEELTSKTDRETHSAERKQKEQVRGENGAEIQALEKRNQREAGGEDETEILACVEGKQSQLRGVRDTEESHSPGRRNREQPGGKNSAENQTVEKRSPTEVEHEDDGKIQRLRGGSQRLLQSPVHRTPSSSEKQNQEQTGGENHAEIQTPGPRGAITETQAPGGDEQEQLSSKIGGEMQRQGRGDQDKGGHEGAVESQDVKSQGKCRAAEGGPRIPGGGGKDQSRGEGAAGDPLQADCFRGEGSPMLTGHEHGTMERTLASAPHAEMKPFLNQGEVFLFTSVEREHLTSQSLAPARKCRAGPQPKPQRNRQRNPEADPGKASSQVLQLQGPQSPAAPSGLSFARLSVSCGQVPSTAISLVGASTALTIPPKWLVLKKSQRQLLESLMRRKIAHMKWGLPQRILESHLLFNFLGPCPPPHTGIRLPESHTDCECQWQQERPHKAPAFRTILKSQRAWLPERKVSKLPTQSRRAQRLESLGMAIHPEMPSRARPPGGPREPHYFPEEAPPRTKLLAPRSPRPAAEFRSWCVQEKVPEPSTENSRGRNMVRLGGAQRVERAPSRVRTSDPRASHDHCWKEQPFHEASDSPRLKCPQPTHWRRENLESVEARGAGQQPSSCVTDTSSFKRSVYAAVARLSRTLLNKPARHTHLAKAQHSAPDLGNPDPSLLPQVGDRGAGEDSTSLKRVLLPPGHFCAGPPLSKTVSFQDQGAFETPSGDTQIPLAPQKFGFVKHLRCFLLQHGFRK